MDHILLVDKAEKEALEYSFQVLKAVRSVFRLSIMDIIALAEHKDEASSVFDMQPYVAKDTFRLLQRARLDYICSN